uniref:Uncharacterized protein n=1 Tax=Trichogramma kaykai TaxID=54128 RepID=A0ABD2VYK6_9HYME
MIFRLGGNSNKKKEKAPISIVAAILERQPVSNTFKQRGSASSSLFIIIGFFGAQRHGSTWYNGYEAFSDSVIFFFFVDKMGDNPSSNYAQSAPRVPDDSRLHLLQENFGSSQSPVVDAVEALKELPLKELTDSIKMLTENVMELRSGASSNSAQQNNFINDAVRQTLASANFRGNAFASVQSPIINSHVDLLSLGEANPVGA